MKSKKNTTHFVRNLRKVIDEKFQGNVNELCRKADVPRSTIESLLKGSCDPKADCLSRIAKACGVLMDDLYHGKINL